MEMTTGQYLRSRRQQMGYRIEDVSAAINVRSAQLLAIENGEHDKLPGMIYAVGFVKTYASFLNVDPIAIAEQYKREYEGREEPVQKKNTRKTITDDPYADNRVPSPAVMGGALLFFILCFGIWWFSSADTDEQLAELTAVPQAPVVETASDDIQIPVINDNVQTTVENAPTDSDVSTVMENENDISEMDIAEQDQQEPIVEKPLALSEKDKLKEQTKQSRVTITALETTWLEVADDSRRVLYKQLLRQGEEFNVPDTPHFYLSTGNAGALIFSVDGKKLLPIGATGDILREIMLTPDVLLAKSQ